MRVDLAHEHVVFCSLLTAARVGQIVYHCVKAFAQIVEILIQIPEFVVSAFFYAVGKLPAAQFSHGALHFQYGLCKAFGNVYRDQRNGKYRENAKK